MTILVSDTSVLIDLERGELISCAFKMSATFAVPDVLYERELRDYGGEELVKLGLKVESLDGDGVELAMRHMQAQRHLTVPDSFALALAKRNGWTLLTGDGPLRDLAKAEGVDCHGVLWLLDEFDVGRNQGRVFSIDTGIGEGHHGQGGVPYRRLAGLDTATAVVVDGEIV